MNRPNFYIGSVPVFGDLILAPMDGITTQPFRLLARRFGSAVSYTEFITAVDAIHRRTRLEEHLAFSDEERPLGYQILDNDPERILQAALKLQERRPDFIDLNMGCPAKDVCSRGAGAALLKDPAKVRTIFALLTAHLNVPVTAKIRLGWDETGRNYRDIARLLEDCGISALAIHGRTRRQSYQGMADWDAIAEAKSAVKIPVFANGDVKTCADISRIQAHTGCEAVMIGRAALGNPWIFSRIDRSQVTLDQVLSVMREHLDLNLQFYGEPYGLILFRKHAIRYLAPYRITRELHLKLVTCEDSSTFKAHLASLPAWLANDPQPAH